MINLDNIHTSISAVAPIDGLVYSEDDDRRIIVFKSNATDVQRTTAQALFDAWVLESTLRTKLYKSTFIRRLSVGEAEILYPILEAEDAWIKLLYAATEYFIMSDALVGYLHMVLTDKFGEERADVLLEPEV